MWLQSWSPSSDTINSLLALRSSSCSTRRSPIPSFCRQQYNHFDQPVHPLTDKIFDHYCSTNTMFVHSVTQSTVFGQQLQCNTFPPKHDLWGNTFPLEHDLQGDIFPLQLDLQGDNFSFNLTYKVIHSPLTWPTRWYISPLTWPTRRYISPLTWPARSYIPL